MNRRRKQWAAMQQAESQKLKDWAAWFARLTSALVAERQRREDSLDSPLLQPWARRR